MTVDQHDPRLPNDLPGLFWAYIDPETASELLLRNTNNRPLTINRSDDYAEDMRADEWYYQAGARVIRDVDGVIVEGQKVLRAIVVSGKAQPVIFVDGVSPDVWAFVDNNQTRHFRDELARSGIGNAGQNAAALKALWQMDHEYIIGGRDRMRISEARRLWVVYGGILREFAADAKRVSQGCNYGSPSIMQAVWQRAVERDATTATMFFAQLELGNREKGNPNPIAQLLRFLDSAHRHNQRARRGPDSTVHAAFLIDAMNAYWMGDLRTLSRWTPARDFPQLAEGPPEIEVEVED